MQVEYPPKGGKYNSAIIPLRCACPPDCQCKSNELRNWCHKPCSHRSFITEKGDILCKYHLGNCSAYFIKDASFQCNAAKQANTWNQYRSTSQFLMAIAQGLQAAEFTLSDNDLVHFATSLNMEIIKRWNQ